MATTSSVAESTPGGGPNICHTCSEQISTAQFIRVGAYKFHKDHFTCCECHTSLHGKKFHHKEGKFYCAQDYVEKFCHTCRHCKQKIATGSVIQAFGGYYHPEHFVCKTCSKPFPNGKYYESGDEPYCIAEGSVVSTAYGTSVAIECATDLPALLTLDAKSGEIVHASPSRHLTRGVKSCVELQFHDGRTLVCTPDHRMRTSDGAWMHAADMQERCTAVFASAVAPVASAHEDESAASPHSALSLHSPAARDRALSLLRLAGYFAFDAAFTADKLNALDRDAFTHDLQLSSADDAELAVAASASALPPSVAAALAQLRVPASDSLPSFLIAADCPLSLVREFVASCFGRYAAALSIDCAGLTLPLPSDAIAQQLQSVLARFGVASACTDRALVLSLSSLLPFTDSVGFRYASHAAQRLALAASYQRSLLSFKSLSPPPSFAAFLSECGPTAVQLFNAASCPSAPVQPFSLRLVSRRAVGDRRVFDLSVPSSSAFFAGGLLVHNCDEHYFLITAEKCASCSLGVKESDMVRVQGKVFHQACLSCCHCGLPLAKKGAIFQKDGMVYCRADYLNFFCKRCTACANHILKHCVSVNDEFYHPECLQCSYCKKVLSKYICISGNLRCNDHTENAVDPVKCTQCQLVIQGEVVLSVGQKLHQDCFKCGFCKKALAKATAKLKDDKLCCPECMLKKDPNLLARNAAAAAAGGYEDDAAASLAVAPAAGAGAGSSKASTAAASAQSPQPEVSDWNVYVDPKKRAGSRVAKPQSRAAGEKIEWKKGELIGKGSFGKVYMAMNSATGELIAVKQVRLNTAEEQEQAAAIQNEIGLMENLRHPNIVSLLGTQRNGNKLNILMEYVPGKCWGRGTQLMRADGTSIAVEDIKVGMQLMGDDCTPRTVQPRSIVHGIGEMFEIQLESRESWRCNAEHILVLRMSDSGAEVEMSVAEYLKLDSEVQKKTRMFAVNPAEHGVGVGVDAVPPAAVSAKACASSPFTLTPVGEGEYFGFALDGNRRCLLSDGTVTHNSLDSLLEKFGGFSEKVIRSYTKQLLEALMYCHGNRVVHRDIKGKNILIDTKGNLKLADFGSAKRFTNVMSKDAPSLSYNYTPLWTAPEVLVGDYNSKVDIWSLGCVIIEMASAKPPWSEQNFENPFRALYHIGNSDSIPKIPDTLSEVGVAFVKQCLRRNPDERPDAATLLKMDWLSGIEALPNTSDDSGSDGEEDGGIKSGSESD